jgi:hypothetical protein
MDSSPALASTGVSGVSASDTWLAYRRQADAYFRVALAVTAAMTMVLLFFAVTGRDGGAVFGTLSVGLDTVARVAIGLTIMTVLWGWLWLGIKRLLLRKWCGFSNDEMAAAFGSRLRRPFDLDALLRAHPERRVRITDMIGRRGRFFFLGLAGFVHIHSRVSAEPTPAFLFLGLQESLLDAVALNWLMLGGYYVDGFFGRVAYGAQTRILDGTLGRANCLVITTLWSLFKFVMVPLGFQLAAVFPPNTYATLFGFVWLSYLVGDGAAEIVGQSFGAQKLRVWGIGQVNRKSVAGTWACFLGSLSMCVFLVATSGLGPAWIGLAVAVSLSNTVFELFSPRGTDDFTMATANALICLGFGAVAM